VPPDDPEAPYAVTPEVTEPCFSVRGWIRGIGPLDDGDPREFYAEVPRGEYYIPAGDGQPGVQGRPPRRRQEGDGNDEHR
jgi:hypothetical protein